MKKLGKNKNYDEDLENKVIGSIKYSVLWGLGGVPRRDLKISGEAEPTAPISFLPYLRCVTHCKFLIVGPDQKMGTTRP